MLAEQPLALSFLLPSDLYLLVEDRTAAAAPVEQVNELPQVAEPAVAYQPPAFFNYTGGYEQKVLILVHYPEHEVMEPAHLTALESTIKRKEMTLNDVAILNISKHPDTDLAKLTGSFKPEKILLLGKDTLVNGLAAPVLNQLVHLGGSILLYSFSFNEMMGNKDNTKAFWEQMKML